MSGPGGSPALRKAARAPGKLGGDATLQHWFQCKGGAKGDVFLSWSDPLWVARGVQVLRFDGQIGSNEESWGHRGIAEGGSGEDGGGGDDGREGFGTGSAREVQVHVVERAGGFVMSFAEGGFEGAAADGVGVVESSARDNHHLESRWDVYNPACFLCDIVDEKTAGSF